MGDMWKYTLALAVILTIFLIAYFVGGWYILYH